MISVNEGRASFGTSTAESVKEAYDGDGRVSGRPQRRLRHVASFGFSLMFIYTHPDSNIQSIADLKGRKIVYGGGTGSALLGKQILDVYGISCGRNGGERGHGQGAAGPRKERNRCRF